MAWSANGRQFVVKRLIFAGYGAGIIETALTSIDIAKRVFDFYTIVDPVPRVHAIQIVLRLLPHPPIPRFNVLRTGKQSSPWERRVNHHFAVHTYCAGERLF